MDRWVGLEALKVRCRVVVLGMGAVVFLVFFPSLSLSF